jgi:hypothetical protein
MRKFALFALILAGSLPLLATDASAVVCAKGVYRAGCVGQHGAVVGHRAYHRGGVTVHGYRRSGTTVRHYSSRNGSRTVIRHR